MTTQEAQFNVGGVRLARPFRIRRLGHFGVNVRDPEASRDFYCRLLGFRISDPLDFGPRLPEAARAKVGPTIGYFARHGTDHHSFVFFPRGAYSALNEWAKKPQGARSEEHTSELQSRVDLVCRLLLEKKKKQEHLTPRDFI